MRYTIAIKLFFGFLIVIILNVLYFVIVSKLSDLNAISSILRRENEVENRLIRVANLQNDRKRNWTSFAAIGKKESADNFRLTSATISGLLDSMAQQLSFAAKLDSIVSPYGFTEIDTMHLAEILQLIGWECRSVNEELVHEFDAMVNFGSSASPELQAARIEQNSMLDSTDRRFQQAIRNAQSLFEHETDYRLKDIADRINNARQITIILLGGTTLFALFFAFVFSRVITKNLRRLKESASRIGKGEFGFDPRNYPNDEIGDLVTAFNDMQVDLKTAQEELIHSKRLAAIGEIVASVNHEINNPLMIISGNAQFLELSMKNFPDELKDRVKAILDETQRISDVTKKLREIKNPVSEDYTARGEQMINLDKSILN